MSGTTNPDEACIGPNGDGHCPHKVQFIVAGDRSCIYHLISVIRRRWSEVRVGVVAVYPPDDPEPEGWTCVPITNDPEKAAT